MANGSSLIYENYALIALAFQNSFFSFNSLIKFKI
uniref:Bm14408 n=1 Tax=Brugia malayi TaxID=6279 RepID=A0A1I9G363_BRUMA|nr:Bm14408 [Brugia malayi]